MDKANLVNLLTRNQRSTMARQLLQEFPDKPDFTITGPIPIQSARSIYRLRSIRNESLGEPIKGFPELVQGLADFAGESIVIYSVDSSAVSYKIFADTAQEEFAGILKFPQGTIKKADFAQPKLQAA